jgi:hypothetical protein
VPQSTTSTRSQRPRSAFPLVGCHLVQLTAPLAAEPQPISGNE